MSISSCMGRLLGWCKSAGGSGRCLPGQTWRWHCEHAWSTRCAATDPGDAGLGETRVVRCTAPPPSSGPPFLHAGPPAAAPDTVAPVQCSGQHTGAPGRHPRLFLISTYVIGKEKVLLEVHRRTKLRIYADERKMGVLACFIPQPLLQVRGGLWARWWCLGGAQLVVGTLRPLVSLIQAAACHVRHLPHASSARQLFGWPQHSLGLPVPRPHLPTPCSLSPCVPRAVGGRFVTQSATKPEQIPDTAPKPPRTKSSAMGPASPCRRHSPATPTSPLSTSRAGGSWARHGRTSGAAPLGTTRCA